MTDDTNNLNRLLRPQSIAVIGGSWGRNVVEQCLRMQFDGRIWPIHPKLDDFHGVPCFRTVQDLPAPPDATFIGVNRKLTIDIVNELAAMGAGGAVCFASGFSEAAAEDESGQVLQEKLLMAASGMPIIGPNCYGLINYLDGALLWPDQHGGKRVSSGVAIITQSSNIAINMTMQCRGLPIAYVMTAGNQAKVSLAKIACALLDDERVTAIGLHIEGFADIPGLQKLSRKAHGQGVGVVVIKAGRTEQSQSAMVSHTNSLSGSDASASALIERLGFARVSSIPSFLESLKLLHCYGALQSSTIASMSCSGGEAGLMADAIGDRSLEYPPLDAQQVHKLREALGPMVALANPLDYHTYIWNDPEAMTNTFAAMLSTPAAMTFLVIDFPRSDLCEDDSWWVAIEALLKARDSSEAAVAVLATLPENLPEPVCDYLMQRGVPAFGGVEEALDAVAAAFAIGSYHSSDNALLQSDPVSEQTQVLSESEAKAFLKNSGLPVENFVTVTSTEQAVAAADVTGYPLVLKALGIAHKSEQDAVVLDIQSEKDLRLHCSRLLGLSGELLVEPFCSGAVAELLVGVVREADGLFRLTVGAGGIYTELLHDTVSMLLPLSEAELRSKLEQLKISAMLHGYRGQAGADRHSILQSILQLGMCVEKHHQQIVEVEINPLLCFTDKTIVADALITATASVADDKVN